MPRIHDGGGEAEAAVAVVGGTIVTDSTIFDGSILIDDGGVISGIVSPSTDVSGRETIDASGFHIFAGGIDTHSHFNDPGLTASEDFLTGTSGAAAGGYTTVLEMPQTQPLVDSRATLTQKLQIVSSKAVVDFGLYSALVPDNCSNSAALRELAELGTIGLKGFVCSTPEMPTLSESQLAAGFEHAMEFGLPVAVHCESQAVIDYHTRRLADQLSSDVSVVADAHPLEAEEHSVRVVLELARMTGGRLHLVHMSDPATVRLAHMARLDGVDVSIETCPHYLALSRDDLQRTRGWGLCYPPLRSPASVNGLWVALENGIIDAIGSDHCAYTLDEKEISDARQVLPGITGIQVALPVLIHGAIVRGIALTKVARAFSAAAARRFGLHPVKGSLQPGADADLVLVEVGAPVTAHASNFFTRCPGTAYEGMTFNARVRRTLVRGGTVYLDDGTPTVTADPGSGRFIHGVRARESAAARRSERE